MWWCPLVGYRCSLAPPNFGSAHSYYDRSPASDASFRVASIPTKVLMYIPLASDNLTSSLNHTQLRILDTFIGRDVEITRLTQQMISSSTDDMRRKVCVIHGYWRSGEVSTCSGVFSKASEKSSPQLSGLPVVVVRRSWEEVLLRLPNDYPKIRFPKGLDLSQKTATVMVDAIITDILQWFSHPSNDKWL